MECAKMNAIQQLFKGGSERCMINKGYRFTGECYDNEISRASPACGAP